MRLHYHDVVSSEGGTGWYLLLDAILLVPVGMSFMFWPIQTALAAGAATAVTYGLYKVMHRTHS